MELKVWYVCKLLNEYKYYSTSPYQFLQARAIDPTETVERLKLQIFCDYLKKTPAQVYEYLCKKGKCV